MIAVYKDNSVIYPTDIYEKYNKYLIAEFEKILDSMDPEHQHFISDQKVVQHVINKVKILLENNTGELTREKLLNVTSWEEELNHYYYNLDRYFIHNKLPRALKIETLLRKEKLNKLKNIF